jgi:hypothetical protein
VDSVTSAGTVLYRVQGASIRDDGTRLYVTGPNVSASAAETLLHAAYARFGPRLGVDGDQAFQARLLAAAVRSGLPITFADEQLERRRLALQRTQSLVRDVGVPQARTTVASRPGRVRHMR